MINLAISFGWFYLIVFLCLFAVNCIWTFYCFKTHQDKFILILPILLNITTAVFLTTFIEAGLDASEHLHCAWLISKGLVPYKDFWQHHFPMIWICLAPLIGILKPNVGVFIISRVFCTLLFIIISLVGWDISKKVWKDKAKLTVYLRKDMPEAN